MRLEDDPAAKARWSRTSRLKQYNLTEEGFARLLATQGNACGMCHAPFREGQQICIDHDHVCCPEEKRSCGYCVRGLLCLDCNTGLGHIERKLAIAQAYLAAPPALSEQARTVTPLW